MHTVKLLTTLVQHHAILAYAIVFVGLIFEGEVVLISTGIMTHLGALNFYWALLFILAGALVKTFLGYQIGVVISNRWHESKALKYIEKKVLNIMPNFKQKPFWSIFISKFIMGINHITIIFAGFEKIDYKKYLTAEISATLIWAPLLLFLGDFFGYTALHVSRQIGEFSLVVLSLVVSFILFDKLVGWIYEVFEEFYNNNK